MIHKILKIWRESLPLILTFFSVLMITFSNIYLLAQKKNVQLMAGYGLGNTIWNGFLQAPIISLNEGFYTQASQAYGAQQFKLIGKLTQKQICISIIYLIAYTIFILFIENILQILQLSEETTQFAIQFLTYTIPCNIMKAFFQIIRTYMIAQENFSPPMIIQNSCTILYVILVYFLVEDFEIKGICFALFILDALSTFFGILYILKKEELQKAFLAFEIKNLEGIIIYFIYTVQCGLIMYLEWSFFEINCFILCLTKNEIQIAVHVTFVGILMFFYMIPKGMADFACQQIGESMGAGQIQKSQELVKLFNYALISMGIIQIIVCTLIKDIFVYNLTSTPETQQIFKTVYDIYIYLFFAVDCFQCMYGCILKSLGLQNFAVLVFLIVYYIIGIPLMYFVVVICQSGIYGSWLGNAFLSTITSIILYKKIQRIDYQQQYIIIQKNLNQSQKQDLLLN